MTRLLVECTYVFEHPSANSGIQRVVRNVIQQLPAADENVECIPVVVVFIRLRAWRHLNRRSWI